MKVVYFFLLILITFKLNASKPDSLKISHIDSLKKVILAIQNDNPDFKIKVIENCDCKRFLGIIWKKDNFYYYRVIKRDSLIFSITKKCTSRKLGYDLFEEFYYENNNLILYYKAQKKKPELKNYQKIMAYFDNGKIIKLVTYNFDDNNNIQDSLSNDIIEAQSENLKNRNSDFCSSVDINKCCYKIKSKWKRVVLKTRYNML